MADTGGGGEWMPSDQIRTLPKWYEIKPAVIEHASLNLIQGIIRYANKPNYGIDMLLEALKEHNVTNIHQIKKKSNDTYQHTNIFILTFNACELPKQVNVSLWGTRVYIPRPRRCYKCQASVMVPTVPSRQQHVRSLRLGQPPLRCVLTILNA